MGDWASSNYGHLFDNSNESPGLIRDHIHLHRFIARLMSFLGENEHPEHRLTGLNDALFILSTSLEDHPDSHDLPDVDVPAAAQYMIHAGELFFKESNKGSVDFQKRTWILLFCLPPQTLSHVFSESTKKRAPLEIMPTNPLQSPNYFMLFSRSLTFVLGRTGQTLAAQSPLWATKGQLWSKQPGLSRDRWDFWKSRFKEIAGSDKVAHATAIDADTAMRAMTAVEKSGEVKSGNLPI